MTNVSKYSKEQFKKIGNNVASLWGASCIGYYHDKENDEYVFECVEHGEEFITTLKEEELKEYYY